MKYNKGFAPLVVLLIVLGLVVVGGGAYMTGKNASLEKKTGPGILVKEEVIDTPIAPAKEPTDKDQQQGFISPIINTSWVSGSSMSIKIKTSPKSFHCSNGFYLYNASNQEIGTIGILTEQGKTSYEWVDVSKRYATCGSGVGENSISVPNGQYKICFKEDVFDDTGYTDKNFYCSGLFTIKTASVSTSLPKYVGSFSICGDGSSLCWPPKITTSSQAYSCNNAGVAPNTEGNDVTTQKVIDGRTYCIHSQSSGYTGGRGYEYTYTTSNGAGTKIATFGINYVSCASYDDPAMSECKTSQNAFKANLDALIDSLM
jgi:hypothetical protein